MNTIVQAEIPQQLCQQAQILIKHYFQGEVLQEVINDALRRYVESHQELLTEAFIEEDVEWGLHGDD